MYVFFTVGKTLTNMWFFVGRPLMWYASASGDALQAMVLREVAIVGSANRTYHLLASLFLQHVTSSPRLLRRAPTK
jgi:hypothetical protein